MNPETFAALSPVYGLFAKFDATTLDALNKMCNPLAGIITPKTIEAMNKMCPLAAITPELTHAMATQSANMEQYAKVGAAVSAAIEQRTKITKLLDSILPLPSRR